MKNLAIILAVIAIVLTGAVYLRPVEVTVTAPGPLGAAGSTFTEKQSFLGGFATGGGTEAYAYSTTTSWDSGSIAVDATSSANFVLRPAGQLRKLPAVGDTCVTGNTSASSTQLEQYSFKVTSVNTATTQPTASGTLLYSNRGPAIDYGVATLNIRCINGNSN